MAASKVPVMDHVTLSHEQLNVNAAVEAVTSPSCGAVSLFVGMTRDNFEGRGVVRLEYESYESMAQAEMKKICVRARCIWPSVGGIAVLHRLGVVPIAEASVVIAVAAPHRQAAFKATAFLIDTLKATVPIWKKEVYEKGQCMWKENKECSWSKTKE
uniref:molybdopterin synthase catalytic subunit-like n=1 Tax=Myxine glutinosa TaxID=7769 RepID=UPI00358F2212